jgi:uncharacterized protein YcbK (DUF882 family)
VDFLNLSDLVFILISLIMKKLLKKILIILSVPLFLLVGYAIYLQSLRGVDPKTIEYYKELQVEVKAQGYSPSWIVTSTVRPKWFNDLLVEYGGAASKSQHLVGGAIDIIVLDVNGDRNVNSKDVDIIYNILNKKIIRNKGGIGTYKKENSIDKQMVHFDSRGFRKRWHR